MSENTNSPVMVVNKISKSFGKFVALEDVSLRIKKGEIFGFLGPNGAGKTTTIRIILNILRPDSGSVTIFGESNKMVKYVHKRVGFLSSEMEIDDDLTGKQYLKFINRLYGGKYDYRIKELADTLEVEISKKIRTYSTGQRQKIGLIAALMHEPDLLILDEPTSGFDPIMQEKFVRLISDFRNNGGTVLMSSHMLSEVQQLCDRVAFIKEGLIIGTRTLTNLGSRTTKRIKILANPRVMKQILVSYKSLPGLNSIHESNQELIFAYNGEIKNLLRYFSTREITDIMIEEPDLEDVFAGLYKANAKNNLI